MLIEDNIDHAELVIRATQEHPIPNQVCHFRRSTLLWIIWSVGTPLVIQSPVLVRTSDMVRQCVGEREKPARKEEETKRIA